MAHNYYYFVASLPYIIYGDKPPISSIEFREQCRNFLDKSDDDLIQYCCFDPKIIVEAEKPTGSAFIDFLLLRERILNLTLANLRAAKLRRLPVGDPPQDIPRAEALAKTAFEMDDPLGAELMLDRARWSVLEELVGINYFHVNNIYAYLLKLQLLERKQRFTEAEGAEQYQEMYQAILNDYNSKTKKED